MNNYIFSIVCALCMVNAAAQDAAALVVGDSLYALGNYSNAIAYYKKAANTDAKIARSYAALGNNAAALTYYEKAIATKDVSTLTRYNYGKLLLQSARYNKADTLFQALTKERPKNPEFVYQLGVAKEKLNDSTFFLHYGYAYVLDPDHQNALYKLAKYTAEKRNFNLSITYIDLGLTANPNSIRFLNLKAIVTYVNKSYHNAATLYEQLIALKQSNVKLHENLAHSYNQTNRFEKAITQYTILINEYDDKNPKWHFNIATNFAALRYLDKAQHHYELAIALQDIPLDASYIALAAVFKKQKAYKKQFETLQKAVQENSKNQAALYFLATAADNYFEDDLVVLPYYEKYLSTFGEKGQFSEFARVRIKDLKTDIHMEKKKQ